jgi:mRNA interferase RelE/StbE
LAWQIELDAAARKDLLRLDRQVARRISSFLHSRVARLDDPRSIGEALIGAELGKFWKYRVGDYRVICDIQDGKLTVLALRIRHRREVYRM